MEEYQSVEMDNTMDKVIRHIYAACDSGNTDLVPVSFLIEFIKPYMPNNSNDLDELQSLLDPQGVDISVNSSAFYNAMTAWTEQLKQKKTENCNIIEDSDKVYGVDGIDYCQIIKSCSEMLNMSDVSLYDSLNTVPHNKTNHEEQIKELQYQLSKVTNELELAKEQLITTEEENDSLLSELKRIKNTFQTEQLTIEQYEKNKVEFEQLREKSELANSKICQLETTLAEYEKQYQILHGEIKIIENQKFQLENKLTVMENQVQKAETYIFQLQEKLDLRESENTAHITSTKKLQVQLDEKQELVLFYIKENKFLQEKMESMEKVFQEKVDCDHSLSPRLVTQIKLIDYSQTKEVNNGPISSSEEHNVSLRIRRTRSLDSSYIDKRAPPAQYVVERCHEQIKNGRGDESIFQSGITTKLRSPHKSLRDEIAEALIDSNKENIERDFPESGIRNLHQLLKGEECIKNTLFIAVRSLLSENEQLNGYKKDYENLVLIVNEKDQAIEDLKRQDATNQEYLNIEKAANSELRRQLEVEFKKNKDLRNKQANSVLNNTQANLSDGNITDVNVESLFKENAALVKAFKKLENKFKELKDQNEFLSRTKEAVEKLWKDNESSIQKTERILTGLYEKLEKHLSFTNDNVDEINDSTCDFVGKVLCIQKMVAKVLSKLGREGLTESLRVTGTNNSISSETLFSHNSTCNLALSKASNFSRLQLKIERLQEKLEKNERDCQTERNLSGDLNKKNHELIVEKSQLITELEACRKLINDLVQKQKDLQEENQQLLKDKDALNSQVQIFLNELALENATTKKLRDENLQLIQHQQFYVYQRQQELINDMHQKQQFNEIYQQFEHTILQLNNLIKEKENKIKNLQQNVCIDDLLTAISNLSNELWRTTSAVISRIKSQVEPDFNQVLCDLLTSKEEKNKFPSKIEEEMFTLSSNVNLAVVLLETVVSKLEKPIKDIVTNLMPESSSRQSVMGPEKVTNVSNDDESFHSCSSETFLIENDVEKIPRQVALFDNMELYHNDSNLLSRGEMEGIFTALSLDLAVDFTSTQRRFQKQKERFDQLSMRFSRYLNNTIELLKKSDESHQRGIIKTGVIQLQLLNALAVEVFETAEQYGVLKYEIQTMNFWKFVTNYVALLSQESNSIKQ